MRGCGDGGRRKRERNRRGWREGKRVYNPFVSLFAHISLQWLPQS
jgi:hypothetical protein